MPPGNTNINLGNSNPQVTQTLVPSAQPLATNTGPAPTPAPAPAAQVAATPPAASNGVMDFVKKHKNYFIGGGILLLILISIYIYQKSKN